MPLDDVLKKLKTSGVLGDIGSVYLLHEILDDSHPL